MPSISPNSLVLVTGASGFVAAWTCLELLKRGFTVRGTVRSKEKGDYLKKLFEVFKDKFSYVIVEDLEKNDAFDDAAKGVDGIAHIASPFHFNTTDPHRDLITPAINGTLALLQAGKKSTTVKRVVLTSSFAAVGSPKDPNHIFTAKDWNEHSLRLMEEKGAQVDKQQAYRASKVLAEKAAWNFMEDKSLHFDLVTLCPPWVFGPIIHQVSTADSLNTSVKAFYRFLIGQAPVENAQAPMGLAVDVRDLAMAHANALIAEGVGGNRYLVPKAPYTFQDFLDVVHEDTHLRKGDWPAAPVGIPGNGKKVQHIAFDATPSETDLGMVYRPMRETVIDMCNSLKDRSKEWE
ncbi:hypothetical protein O181_036300 [Austropuccinia psidii MF-1]|uniref:NAD-dependent epimerase/dehydratase domain-containing protein n=1 Tax=Austropuccinia psidii MF-1 TaxID=1389203 RepID=A0A9Q3HC24_9BASI|nr:hypothetical protein [Austropuccinia psidii MF-1]